MKWASFVLYKCLCYVCRLGIKSLFCRHRPTHRYCSCSYVIQVVALFSRFNVFITLRSSVDNCCRLLLLLQFYRIFRLMPCFFQFLPAQRYASAVFAVIACLSVCLSVTGRSFTKRLNAGSRTQRHTIAHAENLIL